MYSLDGVLSVKQVRALQLLLHYGLGDGNIETGLRVGETPSTIIPEL